jgi:hypothetical protein
MIVLMTLLIAGASIVFAVRQWWRSHHMMRSASLLSHGLWQALP